MYSNNPTTFRTNILNSIKQLLRYYDLGYILNNLESIIILPNPIKYSKQSKEEYAKNRCIYNQAYSEAEKTSIDFETELMQRENIFKYLRTIEPDFCLNMNKKVSLEEHDNYLNYLRNLTKDISKLSVSLKDRNENDYSELLLSKKDFLSKIIDSPDNTEMANIEDKFVLSELDKLDLKKVTEQEMLENILKLKKDLQQRISKHQIYNTLNNKGNKIILRVGKNVRPSSTPGDAR